MKRLVLIGAIALAAGCAVDNNVTSSSSYTETQYDAETGLTLDPSSNMWATFPEMVQIYKETEACLNHYTYGNGPIDAYHDVGDVWGLYDPSGSWSIFYGVRDDPAEHSVIISNPDLILDMERDNRTDREVLAHEFIHHILFMNGLDMHHTNPLFSQCGVGVNTHN
jgi:hypothetical protein